MTPFNDRASDSRKQDQRIRRSRRLLGKALVELALERPFDSITVRELTERAGVGYATFFRHYAGKEQLLMALLIDLIDELSAKVAPLARDRPAAAAPEVFRHAAVNAPLYRVLLRTAHITGLVQRAVEAGVLQVSGNYRPRPGSTVPAEIAAEHLIRSFVGLIDWWLEREMPYPPEVMGEVFDRLVRIPVESEALEPRR